MQRDVVLFFLSAPGTAEQLNPSPRRAIYFSKFLHLFPPLPSRLMDLCLQKVLQTFPLLQPLPY